MSSDKLNVLLIGPFPDPITGNSLANDVLFRGLKAKQINVKNIDMATEFKEDVGKFSISKVYQTCGHYLEIYKLIQSDVVYITIGQSFWGVLKYSPFIYLSKLLGKELVVHIHGNQLWREYSESSRCRKKILCSVLTKIDKGIVLSPSLRKNLSPFVSEKNLFSVYNFAENSLHELNIEKTFSSLNIIFLSNLMTEKGIFDVLKGLLKLKEQSIPFKAKIAGSIDSCIEAEIMGLFSELADTTEYLGAVKGDAKKRLLCWGNVFLLPTYYPTEGQPISIIEAMVTGCVVITTKHSGIPDIVDERNALFVDPRSPEQIASILSEFSEKKEAFRRISLHNTEYAKRYTEVRYTNNIINIISSS